MKTLRQRYRKKHPKVNSKNGKNGKNGKIKKLPKLVGKIKKQKLYVKEKCHYHKDGIRCTRNAIGSGQLCKKHGGTIDISNTMDTATTERYLAEHGKVSKYLPEVHPMQYIELSRQGLSEVEIAARMEVGVVTLKSWSEKFEAFALAYDIGQALHETWWITRGKEGLDQRNFNTALYKFLTGNKLGYSEKIENKNMNMNIHGVLVVPEKQTASEWEADDGVIDV